ncbi:MAG: nitrogen fixation protein NifQ [Oxalobacter sp.]|nr:MAG: nitrogen fixation protein NifQ [Oxalobacter sp.]
MSMQSREYRLLMEAARDPEDLATLAIAGVFSTSFSRKAPYNVPIYGLRSDDIFTLMYLHFPDIAEPSAWTVSRIKTPDRVDEFDDLLDLLLRNRSVIDKNSLWLAHAIATASMADDHLWQDMGLPSRAVLSKLLNTYFTTLAQRNTSDMKWKKFFYKQLCDEAGINVCRSPSCAECSDYENCFGSEEHAFIQ